MSDDTGVRPASRTLGDLVDEMATATPGAEAVVFRDERLDYAGLKVRVDVFARALLAVGIRHGDRVALLVTNRTEWIIAAFAAAKIGAIVAAISTFSAPRELAWTLGALRCSGADHPRRLSRSALPRCVARPLPRARRIGPGRSQERAAAGPAHRCDGDGRAPAGVFSLPEFLARGALVGAAALAAAKQAVRAEDICYILYTSGSTAAPKGVTLAHGPLLANGFDIGERQRLRASDRLWLAVPLFWSFGSANAVPAIMTHGGCIVLQESFEAGEALALIERERCSVYYGMGNMARALLEHEDHPGAVSARCGPGSPSARPKTSP